jgi:hypothetical protein
MGEWLAANLQAIGAGASVAGCLVSVWAVVAATGARTAARKAQEELRKQWLVHPSLTGLQEHLRKCYDDARGERWQSVQTVVSYALADVAFIREYYLHQLTDDDRKSLEDVGVSIRRWDELTRREMQPEVGGLSSAEAQALSAIPSSVRQAQDRITTLAARLQRRREVKT